MSKLVIVESPTKAHTIQKYLGPGYEVMASMGHIRDLPKTLLGVDIEHAFKPRYVDIPGKTALIRQLKAKAAESDGVILATDPDREGEAISWHLAQLLKVDMNGNNRVTFNEITKSGVQQGMSQPRALDMDLINAQQARRILDRIVGYKISPFLWKKVRKGLSAGRVQSAAVSIIVDRKTRSARLSARNTGRSMRCWPKKPRGKPFRRVFTAPKPASRKLRIRKRPTPSCRSWNPPLLWWIMSSRARGRLPPRRPSSPPPCSRRPAGSSALPRAVP